MKKILVFLLLLVLITGCSNKNTNTLIKCHTNTKDDVRFSRIYMTGNFVNDNLDNIVIDGKIEGSKDALLEDQEFYDWFYGDMSKIDGITFESRLEDNYIFKVIMKINNIPDNSSFNKNELPSNKEEFIKYAGKQGYVCEG